MGKTTKHLHIDIMHDRIQYTYTHLDIMLAQKRLLTVTLDIMCYDDLDVEHIDWKELLELEGNEEVHCSIKEYDPFQSCASLKIGSHSQQYNIIENEDSRETGTDPLAILPDSSYIAFVTETPMIFLTSTNHGCVYTLSQEDGDELYYAPIYSNGNVNLEEFAPVDMNEIDMDQMEVYDIIRQLKVMNEV